MTNRQSGPPRAPAGWLSHTGPMRRSVLVTAVLLVGALVVAGCGQKPGGAPGPSVSPSVALPADPDARAAAIASRLSDVDAVGQLLVPFVYGQDATSVSASTAKEKTTRSTG